jgi:hypothetical protein
MIPPLYQLIGQLLKFSEISIGAHDLGLQASVGQLESTTAQEVSDVGLIADSSCTDNSNSLGLGSKDAQSEI